MGSNNIGGAGDLNAKSFALNSNSKNPKQVSKSDSKAIESQELDEKLQSDNGFRNLRAGTNPSVESLINNDLQVIKNSREDIGKQRTDDLSSEEWSSTGAAKLSPKIELSESSLVLSQIAAGILRDN